MIELFEVQLKNKLVFYKDKTSVINFKNDQMGWHTVEMYFIRTKIMLSTLKMIKWVEIQLKCILYGHK